MGGTGWTGTATRWTRWGTEEVLRTYGDLEAGWQPTKMVARLAAAGVSGGNWLLQGRCKAIALAPLLMVLLLWNILSAFLKLCCFSSNSLQVAVSSCGVSNKTENNAEL